MNYIDIHGHINFDDYDADRSEVIKRAQEAGVGMILVGTDLESSKKVVELANAHGDMWAIIGQHPTEKAVFDYEKFLELAQNTKVVGIGECGLDYFHSKPEDITLQKENFLAHIRLANEVNKPLMLHIREAKKLRPTLRGLPSVSVSADLPNVPTGAYQEAVQILKEHAKVHANFHFFAGNIEDVKAGLEIGASFSFTGVLTFTKDYDEVVRMIPLESIMSETDCPFVAPAPYRGKRNEPSYVIETVKATARLKGLNEDVVAAQLVTNAKRFFCI